MKKITTAIAMAASLFVATGVIAKGKHDRMPSEEQVAEMVSKQQEAVDELGLLPAVAEQVKTLIADSAEKRYELHSTFRAQNEALREEYDASLSELLTEDEIDALKSAMRPSKRDKFDRDEKFRSAE